MFVCPPSQDMHVTPASVMTGAQHCFVVDSQAVVAHATVVCMYERVRARTCCVVL